MSAVPAAAGPARLQQVDALRGFALFGILVVNIGVFASPYYGSGVVDPAFGRPLDLAASWVFGLLFETKFYLLFSFLFGYSFTLQMAAAERGQAAFLPRFLRRLAGLAALGAAHAVLFYHGDILLTYAILGLLLLCCRNLEPARALRLALWLIGLASAAWAVLAGLSLLDPPGPEVAAGAGRRALRPASLPGHGRFRDRAARQGTHRVRLVVLLLVQGPYAFAMFLVGYALGRRQALEDPWRQPRALGLLLALGLLPGLAGAAFYAWSALPSVAGPSWELPGLAVGLLTSPLLTMSYACAFLLMLRSRLGARLSAWLVPAGRMALTNYLMQSVVCALVFTAWGARQMGLWSPLEAGGLALVIFLAQTAASAWWMRRHAYGPVEWFLRALTVGVWPQWRRTSDGRGAA